MIGMFDSAKTKKLDLSHFDTHAVLNMSYMFSHCEVEELNVSKFNTTNVKSLLSMFKDCNTPKLDLSSFKIAKGKRVATSNMFLRCDAVVEATDSHILKCAEQRREAY